MLVSMDHDELEASATPDELRALMDGLGLTQAALARLVAVDKSAPGRWLTGAVAVPLWLVSHLRLLGALRALSATAWGGAHHENNPPVPLPSRLAHLAGSLDGTVHYNNIPAVGKIADSMIAMSHAKSDEPMTPDAFREALSVLGWKRMDFVRRCGVSSSAASRWVAGTVPIPAWVPLHLALLAQVASLHTQFVKP